jgi:hypothetical protein
LLNKKNKNLLFYYIMNNVAIYRGDLLPEHVGSRILNKVGFRPINVSGPRCLPTENKDGSVIQNCVIYGSYYSNQEIDDFVKKFNITKTTIHMYLDDVISREIADSRSVDNNSALTVLSDPVDNTNQSYPRFTWNRYLPDEKRPESLQYFDAKGRLNYTNPDTRSFIEWFVVKGVCDRLIDELLFDEQKHDLKQAIHDGAKFSEKSDSLVAKYTHDTCAGTYQLKFVGDRVYKVKHVSSALMIELIGLALTKDCDIALVSRFDHNPKIMRERYTAYTMNNDIKLLKLFHDDLPFNAGGTNKCCGFTIDESIGQLIRKFSV